MSAEPKRILFRIRESHSFPGKVSIEPWPERIPGTGRIQSHLTEAGYQVGDVVELSLYHGTRVSEDQLPPPGQLMKRKRSRGKR